MSGWIYGVHPVVEALRSGRRRILRVIVASGRADAPLKALFEAAGAAGLNVERRPAKDLERMAGASAAHQGVAALAAPSARVTADEILSSAGRPQLLVVLDSVEDPRNLGAVIRSAAAAGVGGLFLPQHRATGLTPACLKAASGAAESLPIARVGNIVTFLKRLKEQGIWVAGVDAAGVTPWSEFDMTVPLALVLGGEGRGLRRLARETCDVLLSIPLEAGVESLNLSVAAGVVLFEAVRQRQA
jgi:23S rRNA (guanosine2251-2'-O)-methyltransferase